MATQGLCGDGEPVLSILVLRVAVNHTIAQISSAELAVIVWFWCYGFYGCGFYRGGPSSAVSGCGTSFFINRGECITMYWGWGCDDRSSS